MKRPTRRRVLKTVSTGSVFGVAAWGRDGDRGRGRGSEGVVQSATAVQADTPLEVSIAETDSPVNAGEYLDVTTEVRNTGTTDVRTTVDLVVGHDSKRLGRIRTTIGAGETRTLNQGFYTYPVPRDAEFPVRVEVDGDADERTASVTGADPLPTASPDDEFTVAPGTDVLFEAGAVDPDASQRTVWWVDGDHVGDSLGPWESVYYGEVGAHYRQETFETAGTYDVAAAVIPRDGEGTYRTQWQVDVTAGGRGSPTVEPVRPSPGTVPTTDDETITFELEATDSEGRLDRAVWWLGHADVILDVTELEGRRDTARLEMDSACHGCPIMPWVICTDGALASPGSMWELERVENGDGDDGGDSGDSSANLELSIRTTNSPVDAGEYLEVIVDIENTGTETGEDVLELVVGHDPKVLDTQEITVEPGETGAATLGFETYPTKQDERFPVRVVGSDDTVETSVQVFAR